MLSRTLAPVFSGEEIDFEKFRSEWKPRESMIRQVGGSQEMVELMLFQELQGALDQGSKDLLNLRRQQDPRLTYDQFWAEFEGAFTRDMVQVHRRKWESVRMKNKHENRMPTGMELRTFFNEFELHLHPVVNISEPEIVAKLKSELPPVLREKIQKEAVRRARRSFWVRVHRPGPLGTPELVRTLGLMIGKINSPHEEHPGEVLVDCGSESGRNTALSANGWQCPDGVLKITRADHRMGWREIMKWTSEEIRFMEELGEGSSWYGQPPLPRMIIPLPCMHK
jgi:hypothetical protein